jgi:hypothetical protein
MAQITRRADSSNIPTTSFVSERAYALADGAICKRVLYDIPAIRKKKSAGGSPPADHRIRVALI